MLPGTPYNAQLARIRAARIDDGKCRVDFSGLLGFPGKCTWARLYAGRIDILINTAALELCRSVSKENLQAAYGCDAMQAEMKSGDILILDRTNGAGMTVR
jgi:hypothetical protein